MKLSINDLRVDSYATQVSELELTEVKGGTGWACAIPIIDTVAKIVIAAIEADNDHKECGTTVTTKTNKDGSTTVTTTHQCKE
jgi:hypothetical protein